MNTYIPDFEGRPVDATAIRVSGASPLDDLEDQVLSIDDCVQMVSMFKVVGVQHQVEKATGKLVRVQTLRPIEMHLHPLDPDNPDDDGIVRALPMAVRGSVDDEEDD